MNEPWWNKTYSGSIEGWPAVAFLGAIFLAGMLTAVLIWR